MHGLITAKPIFRVDGGHRDQLRRMLYPYSLDSLGLEGETLLQAICHLLQDLDQPWRHYVVGR